MPEINLSPAQLAELKSFWRKTEHYGCLQAAWLDLHGCIKSSHYYYHVQKEGTSPQYTEGPGVKHIGRYLDHPKKKYMRDNATQLSEMLKTGVKLVYSDLEEKDRATRQPIANLLQLANDFFTECPSVPCPWLRPEQSVLAGDRKYTVKEMEQIAATISQPSTNDPKRPEFPYFSPRFPATPTIEIPWSSDRNIDIKDESHCPTGTHKDRWAWEKITVYKRWMREAGVAKQPTALKALSLISAGSAALALQAMLRHFGLPALRVILDKGRINQYALQRLEVCGCRIYHRDDLDRKFYDKARVLEVTENPLGDDVTSRDIVEPYTNRFYDWLVYEILNRSPKHIFVPVGSGDLLANIVLVLGDEKRRKTPDPRLEIEIGKILPVALYGATTWENTTILDKLYSPFRARRGKLDELIETNIEGGVLLKGSGIFEIKDDEVRAALRIAEETHRITTEPSGIAGLALFMRKENELEISIDEKVLVVNTGKLHWSAS